MPIDGHDDLPPLSDFVAGLSDVSDAVAGARLERVNVSLPIEMDIEVGETGGVELRCSPPTQYTATTVMPTFHRVRARIVPGDDDAG